MGDVISTAVEALQDKLSGGFEGLAKFVIEGEGAILVDADGVRAGEGEADVTLTASAENFRAMFEGELSPTTAFMTGKLKVAGNMGLAMKLAAALA